MDDREQQRRIQHRLAVLRRAEEVTCNVSATCRYYGITRQCFYKWLRRYEEPIETLVAELLAEQRAGLVPHVGEERRRRSHGRSPLRVVHRRDSRPAGHKG